MPIRINLLAEAQAAEELRRKDPVKRAMIGGGIVAAAVVLWCGFLQTRVMATRNELATHEKRWLAVKKDYEELKASKDEADRLRARLNALDRLSTNRFLWGSALNALQFSVVEDIQVVRLKGQQSFTQVPGVPPKTNSPTLVIPGKPAIAIERTTLTINAKDYGDEAEQNYNKFKQAIERNPYFASNLGKSGGVKLIDLIPPTADAANPGKRFMMLILECRFPEVERHE